ncbi:MAG: alanine--tRNA ligase [Candidatus Staskawiczbacteria bacterium]|nr:alanine--tRNA ligase [Candidatus Staskawiczbacteria bacterium]
MTSKELRQKFLDYFEKHGHKIVPSSSLLPTDQSVLFSTAGMQQFKTYYLGEKSPYGKNVASCQKCIRTSDIDEVGDERHLTFFEMLGNFSFGGYFKEEAIKLAHDFIVRDLGLEIDYVTVFSPEKVAEGDWRKGVEEDKKSFEIWKEIGVPEEKIRKEGIDNFWGPTGEEGPCGPTTEIYVNGIEIWNIVFNEFFCDKNKRLKKLGQEGVDTGMGLERLAMVIQKKETVFETDLFQPIISKILSLTGIVHDSNNIPLSVYPHGAIGSNLSQEESVISVRVAVDHIKAATFLIADGVVSSNKGRGYILRRLIRRIITRGRRIGIMKIGSENFLSELAEVVIKQYGSHYRELINNRSKILSELDKEETKFRVTLTAGLRKMEEYVAKKNNNSQFAERDRTDFRSKSDDFINLISGKDAFDLYQTYGFPPELLNEELARYAMGYHKEEFKEEFKKELEKHQELSRTASAGMFKGGLADESEKTVKLHTAAHLMLAGLRKILGETVVQKGSNITRERLRFDFSYGKKMTKEQIDETEKFVNDIIKKDLPVWFEEMPFQKAREINATGVFESKYREMVKVYFAGKGEENVSKEICGGPHVERTGILGHFKIQKEESSSAGIRRIKAVLE